MNKYKHITHTPRRQYATLLGHSTKRWRIRQPISTNGSNSRETTTSIADAAQAVACQQQRASEIEHDLQLARDLQQGLLLAAVPQLAGWEANAVSLPAREIGGDLYDFLPFNDGWHGIMIGDVSGKGLAAALRMAVTRTVFRYAARAEHEVTTTLAAVNRGMLDEIPHGMVTMLYAQLNTNTGDVRIANAGHNYPLLIRHNVAECELTGLPLGVDADSTYREATFHLDPGDTIVLYTDGIVEAENAEGELFGFDRLLERLHVHRGLKPRGLVAVLLRELRQWSVRQQTDDITIVVLRRRLTLLGDELKTVAVDVLGADGAHAFEQVAGPLLAANGSVSAVEWIAQLPALIQAMQHKTGRGPARELGQQLRVAIEDYRVVADE